MFKKRFVWFVVLTLVIAVFFIWKPLVAHTNGALTVHFLDVGQGDAIFIESPMGNQVLIDGGPDRSVLRELGSIMSWSDRSIDMIIATHPDADHIAGLVDVLDRYDIGTVMLSSVEGDTDLWRAFNDAVVLERGEVRTAVRGEMIDIGGAYLYILFPDRNIAHIETNTGSIVARLVYGNTSFLLTGDAPASIEKYLAELDGEKLESNILKAGHHGSRTSSSQEFIDAVQPRFAIFSRGCGNSYGHPHPDVVRRFADASIPTLDTCTEGRITFVSDGVVLMRK